MNQKEQKMCGAENISVGVLRFQASGSFVREESSIKLVIRYTYRTDPFG